MTVTEPEVPRPEDLLPPVESDVEIHPLEEREDVIAGIEHDTTVPGLALDEPRDGWA